MNVGFPFQTLSRGAQLHTVSVIPRWWRRYWLKSWCHKVRRRTNAMTAFQPQNASRLICTSLPVRPTVTSKGIIIELSRWTFSVHISTWTVKIPPNISPANYEFTWGIRTNNFAITYFDSYLCLASNVYLLFNYTEVRWFAEINRLCDWLPCFVFLCEMSLPSLVLSKARLRLTKHAVQGRNTFTQECQRFPMDWSVTRLNWIQQDGPYTTVNPADRFRNQWLNQKISFVHREIACL